MNRVVYRRNPEQILSNPEAYSKLELRVEGKMYTLSIEKDNLVNFFKKYRKYPNWYMQLEHLETESPLATYYNDKCDDFLEYNITIA